MEEKGNERKKRWGGLVPGTGKKICRQKWGRRGGKEGKGKVGGEEGRDQWFGRHREKVREEGKLLQTTVQVSFYAKQL